MIYLTAESFREFAGLLQDVEEGRMMLVGGVHFLTYPCKTLSIII